jgi:hypothetical protein
MIFGKTLERFVEKSPACVMVRGTMENVVTSDLLDRVFEQTARRPYCRELLFSSLVDLLGLVATGARKSVNDAYQAEKEQFTGSVAAVYDKLQGVEVGVSRQMIRQTAVRLAEVVRCLLPRHAPLLPGYRVKIIDGNHRWPTCTCGVGRWKTPFRNLGKRCTARSKLWVTPRRRC